MKIKRTDVELMLGEMGYKAYSAWSNVNMQQRIQTLDRAIEGDDRRPQNQKTKELLEDILLALQRGATIEIEDDRPAKADTKTKTETETAQETKPQKEKPVTATKTKPEKKKTAKTSANGKAKPAKANKKDKPEKKLDRYGSKVGSRTATFNTGLSKTPRTISEIMEITKQREGLKGSMWNHFNKLVKAGLIGKDKKEGTYFSKA